MPPVSRIFFICLPAPNGGVLGNMDYLRYKREPVHHLGWVSAVWVIWCSSSSSTYSRAQPKHQHLATVRNPNPCRLSFQTLRYVQRSNNPPSVWAPPLLFGLDRVGHSCLLGTVAKLFHGANLTGESWKSSWGMKYIGSDIAIRSLPQSYLCGREGRRHHRPMRVCACTCTSWVSVLTECLNEEKSCSL